MAQNIYQKVVIVNIVVLSEASILGIFFSEALKKTIVLLPSSCSILFLIEDLFEVDSGPC